MSDRRFCGDVEVLMSYLYEEGDATERRAFEAHLATCAACSREVAELRGARGSLAAWTPPDTMLDFRIVHGAGPKRSRFAWMAVPSLPLWAQLAAASLVVGIAVGISGFEVRYDQQGLTVRAGWNKPAPASVTAPATPGGGVQHASTPVDAAPWRAEMAALEQRLRGELRQPAVSASAPVTQLASNTGAMSDRQFMTRVQQLIDASETRQQHELAVRLTQVVREMDTQRRTDLARVVDGMGVLEGRTGASLASQRDLLNYLVRVSQK